MERPRAPSRRPPLPPRRGSGRRSLDAPSARHPSLCPLCEYSLGPFYFSRSTAFRFPGLTRCGLQPVCEKGTTRERPCVVPSDKALGVRREGMRESLGSGIGEVSRRQRRPPRGPLRVFTSNCISPSGVLRQCPCWGGAGFVFLGKGAGLWEIR